MRKFPYSWERSSHVSRVEVLLLTIVAADVRRDLGCDWEVAVEMALERHETVLSILIDPSQDSHQPPEASKPAKKRP